MTNRKWFGVVAVGLTAAVIIALFSPFASSHPDGLERVAEDNQFLEKAKGPSYEIIPDYVFPGVENEKIATILSGLVGIVIVAGICFGLPLVLKHAAKSRGSSGDGPASEHG